MRRKFWQVRKLTKATGMQKHSPGKSKLVDSLLQIASPQQHTPSLLGKKCHELHVTIPGT
jgi:hypothetical protein